MGASLRNRSFNIRVDFDDNGEAILGFIHGFYRVSDNITDIKSVPDSVALQIARKLHIEKSSKSLKFNRQAAKAKRKEEKQNTFPFENQALS